MTAGEIRRTLQREFVRTLRKPFVDAVKEYDMVRAGDRIAVCISGGKDSMLLALLMQDLQHTVDFELLFLAMDPGYAPAGRAHLEENAARLELPLEIFETNVLRVAGRHAADNPCFLCAKMRRGALHSALQERGLNKIALGHHYDDAVETMLMSLFLEGRISCFQPVTYLDRSGVTQIRPLLYVQEREVRGAVRRLGLPVVENPCPANGSTRREEMKVLLRELDGRYPNIKKKIFGAIQRYPLYGWSLEEEQR